MRARGQLTRIAVFSITFLCSVIGSAVWSGLSAQSDIVTSRSAIGNYLAGRHAHAQDDIDSAIKFLTATLRALPEIPDLLRQTFLLLVIEGRMKEALPYADRLINNKENAPIAHLAILVASLRSRDLVRQRASIAVQPENGLNGLVKPILKAWIKVNAGKIDHALEELKILEGKESTKTLYYTHKAIILDFAERLTAAEAAYIQLFERDGTKHFRLTQLFGNLLERMGKYEEARKIYKKFSKANPDSTLLVRAYARLLSKAKPKPLIATSFDGAAEAFFNIGTSLRQQRARETAMVFCRLALWLRPDFPIAQLMMADMLDDGRRHIEANALYASIDSKSPFRFPADLRRASNLGIVKRLGAAIKLLENSVKKYPFTAEPLINLGDLMRRNEQWDDAIKFYSKAIDRLGVLEKRHWRILYSRGIVLERAKRWPEAEKDFLRALKFEPDQPYVLNYLGYSWVDKGVNLEKALIMIHNAVRKKPHDGYIIDSLGWVYYRLGNYEKAVTELERAVQLRPEDPIINDHLGDAYWRVGRKLEAGFQWKRALSLKPEAEIEEKVRNKLEKGLLPLNPMRFPKSVDTPLTSDKT